MEKEINGEIFRKFVKENFKTIDEFISETGLSRSHVYKLFDEKVRVGDKTLKKLKVLADKYGFDNDKFYKKPYFKVGGHRCRSICITDKNKKVIAFISKDKLVVEKNYDYFLKE